MRTIIRMMSVAAVAAAMTACSSTDVFDSANVEQKQKADYADNFVKKYGAIDPNQTWDLSTAGERLAITRSGETPITVELVDGLDFGIEETVENGKLVSTITKNLSLYNGVSKKLPDKVRHTGESALLVAPSSSFYIYPISSQGSWQHDLYVQVGDEERVLVYSKDWKLYDKPYVNGMSTAQTIKDGVATVTQRAVMGGVKIQAPVGTPIQIIADIRENNIKKPTASTITGSAIVIDADEDVKPEGVPDMRDDAVITYVGIEDRFDFDFDYNDIVLVMVGNPETPEPVKIEQKEYYEVPTVITKRYMIEDLGATDDFDFNDIVVDVTQTTNVKHRLNIVNDEIISDVVMSTSTGQKAVIRHLGGRLPFSLKIGNTTKELGGPETFDTDTEISFNVTGWNPNTNNVTVAVNDLKSGAVYNIGFPKAGEAPMIIAVDPDVDWMAERKSIPNSWFTK